MVAKVVGQALPCGTFYFGRCLTATLIGQQYSGTCQRAPRNPPPYSFEAIKALPSVPMVAGSGSAETTQLWDLETDALVDRVRRLAGRDLTQEERRQYLLSDVAPSQRED